jgi:hypothetical protein
MTRRLRLACLVVVSTLSGIRELHAQSRWTVTFGAGAAREIVNSRFGSAQTRLTGSLLSGEAIATRGRLVARLRYGQGHVSSDTAARDVVQGELLAGYQARPWLQLWMGPRARTFVTPGLSDRRWLFWTGGISARDGIFPGRVESFADLWLGFSGSLNRPAASASGRGVELGLEATVPSRPLRLRLSYLIEQGRLDDGRRDTVEGLSLAARYQLR